MTRMIRRNLTWKRIVVLALLLGGLLGAEAMKSRADGWPPECQIWDICD